MGGIGGASGGDGARASLAGEVSGWRDRLADLGDLGSVVDGSVVEACGDPGGAPDDRDADRADGDRLAAIEALERLKSAAAAAQARLTDAFRTSRLAAAERAGTDAAVARRSVAGQVALARHDSPVRGGRHVGLAAALVREMPHTLAALAAGEVSEWRATLVARETACLSREHRAAVDAELSGRMGRWGDRRCAQSARAAAYRLDPRGVVDRLARAAGDRRVSIRPAPDTMTYLTGLLPVAQGVAAYAALQRHADTLRASGDPRGRGQIMADELVARLTAPTTAGGTCPTGDGPARDGAAHDGAEASSTSPAHTRPADTGTQPGEVGGDNAAGGADGTCQPFGAGADVADTIGDHSEATGDHSAATGDGSVDDTDAMEDAVDDDLDDTDAMDDDADGDDVGADGGDGGVVAARLPRGVGVEIQLIMTDRALFGVDEQPAILTGHGPLPAELARRLIRTATGPGRGDPAAVWVRRLYTDRTGRLVAMDSRRRSFPPAARRFLTARDQTCRTPWCDAPFRHADHVVRASHGGPTSIINGQGACENCNYTHAAPGWAASADPDGTVHLSTPTGDTHTTDPPPLHPPDPVVDLIHPGGNRPRLAYTAA